MADHRKLTVICGHYGCGKTNLTLNLALEAAERGEQATVADLDVVNPYFRSSEYGPLLQSRGVRLIAPVFANTTLDTPTLPPELFSVFEGEGHVFFDAGGDDAGAVALGGLRDRIAENGYEMLYVVNRYRVLSQTPEEAAALLGEIEAACRLKATGIVNNSHLGTETDPEILRAALPFGEKVARLTGLPLLFSTAPDFALKEDDPERKNYRIVKRYVRFFWETEEEITAPASAGSPPE